MRTVRIALRDWDWLTPLRLGQVGLDLPGHELVVDAVDTLVDPWQGSEHDAYEVSLSRYHRAVVGGDDRVVAIPHVLMQSFRHRCIIVAASSGVTTTADLRGARIGVTGWIDSGNTWTRDILSHEGIEIDDATWIAGRLTASHPETDRLDGFGRHGRVEAAPAGAVMADVLVAGDLDAVSILSCRQGSMLPMRRGGRCTKTCGQSSWPTALTAGLCRDITFSASLVAPSIPTSPQR